MSAISGARVQQMCTEVNVLFDYRTAPRTFLNHHACATECLSNAVFCTDNVEVSPFLTKETKVVLHVRIEMIKVTEELCKFSSHLHELCQTREL